MELTETEKYLISGLKLQKVSKGKLAAICLMLETEKQQMKTSLDKGTQRKTTENELPSLTQCTA